MKEIKKEIIFYVSNGPALCLDCYTIMKQLNIEDMEYYKPVYSDGTGDDGCGLLCDCGEFYDFNSQR